MLSNSIKYRYLIFSTCVYRVHDTIILLYEQGWLVGFIVINATFNNISVISWRSVLLVEETGGPGEQPLTCRKSLTNLIT
jgi:hypothetical protein